MTFASFSPKLRNIAEITSDFAPIKGFLWDMEYLIFLAGIAIYIFEMTRFSLNKTGILEKYKKNSPYTLHILSTNSNIYYQDFKNKIKGQAAGIHIEAQKLLKENASSNILALVGVIGLILILAFIVIFLRSISPYPVA